MNNTAKEPCLIPYPVIEAAISGDTDAVNNEANDFETTSTMVI